MPLLFAAAAFLSAALIFFVEPMIARMILPLLGGAPAVWNTCVVVYQSLLFAGYAYAHLLARRTTVRAQLISHVALLTAGIAVLPLAVGPSWTPPASGNPIGWVFGLLLTLVGLPFFALAATGPLVQHWYGVSGSRGSINPYALYAASNLGSLLALLAYPLVIEPALRLHSQSVMWTAMYATLVALLAGSAIAMWRSPEARASVPEAAPSARARRKQRSEVVEDDDPWTARFNWLLLALLPSSLMLSVTTFITTDVAAVPLLWIVPLSLYLLTFVIAFAERRWIPAALLDRLFPAAVIGVVALALAQNAFPVLVTIAWHLACFSVIALSCHQRLADARPGQERLTEFYLWVSAGGAIGGLLTTLVAPLVFVSALEYPLAAISACVLLPAVNTTITGARRIATFASPLVPSLLLSALLLLLARVETAVPDTAAIRYLFVFLLPLIACFFLRRTPLLMGLALSLLLLQGSFVRFDTRVALFIERTFYGEHRVMFTGAERLLTSGTTNHGAQSVKKELACEPLTYYSRGGPVGQIFDHLKQPPARTRFGVVGLGTGSMAAYAAPGQSWTFFEINPAVERIARDRDYFTYLRDCAPQSSVVLGDARLSLERAADSSFDVMFIDAFSSDAIPVHLLTTEAMQLYFRKLSASGVLAVHISNRYLDLTPVIAGVARAAGLTAAVQAHQPTEEQRRISDEIIESRWTLLARNRTDLEPFTVGSRWQSLESVEGPAWSDDYSNVIGTIRW